MVDWAIVTAYKHNAAARAQSSKAVSHAKRSLSPVELGRDIRIFAKSSLLEF